MVPLRRRLLIYILLFATAIYIFLRFSSLSSPPPTLSFPPSPLTKHLILASTPLDHPTWAYTLPASLNLIIKHYSTAPSPGTLSIPINKGNEAMAYLTYIITHYHALPDIAIFTHAHEVSWHNNDLLSRSTPEMLCALNFARVERIGYMSLRCHLAPGCPVHPALPKGVFRELFPDEGEEEPERLGGGCCAQFAVTAERIRERSRAEYVRWREWLVTTKLGDKESGRVWEYLWGYVFLRRAAVCEKEHVCYCDGYGVCLGGEEEFKKHLEKGKEVVELEAAVGMGGGDKGIRRKIETGRSELEREVARARERGRDPEMRRKEVGEEFSG